MTRHKELLWFKRLRRVLDAMPETVEIQVHNSSIQMNEAGAREATFLMEGTADNVEEIAYFQTDRVYPCSESI